jgi:hypothetical protein
MSGYFTVLIYEYAAEGLDKCAQTAATRLLNLCFQVSYYNKDIMIYDSICIGHTLCCIYTCIYVFKLAIIFSITSFIFNAIALVFVYFVL